MKITTTLAVSGIASLAVALGLYAALHPVPDVSYPQAPYTAGNCIAIDPTNVISAPSSGCNMVGPTITNGIDNGVAITGAATYNGNTIATLADITSNAPQVASLTTSTAGTVTWTYPIAYPSGTVPVIQAVGIAASGSTSPINVQLDGAPTNTQAKFRVTVTNLTAVSLIGLTILSVPASPGATNINVIAYP